jgi:hypothetical protein
MDNVAELQDQIEQEIAQELAKPEPSNNFIVARIFNLRESIHVQFGRLYPSSPNWRTWDEYDPIDKQEIIK